MTLKMISLALILTTLTPVFAEASSSLTIYVYPPRHKLNWSSPKGLLKSFAGSAVERGLVNNDNVTFTSDFGETGSISSRYKSTMGHTIGHASCKLSTGQKYERWTSFSGQDFREVDNRIAFKEKLGMGVLFYDFPDGHIVSGDENIQRLTYYQGHAPKYLRFQVEPKACDELKAMIDFFEGFHFPKDITLEELEQQEAQSLLYFTTNMDPYDSYIYRTQNGSGKVGGGCAPYGVSLIKAIGQFDPIFAETWMYHQPISEKLMNGVSFQKILLTDLGNQWTYEGYPNRIMSQYDPQLIWDFVGDLQSCINTQKCSAQAAAYLQKVKAQAGEVVTFKGQVEKTRRRAGKVETYLKPIQTQVQGVEVSIN